MRLAIGLMAIGMLAFGLIALGAGAVFAQQTGITGTFIQAGPIADTVAGSEALVPSTPVRWYDHRGFYGGWYGSPWRSNWWGSYYPYSYYYGNRPNSYYKGYQTCWTDGWSWYCGD
jgi:hypothetical protein